MPLKIEATLDGIQEGVIRDHLESPETRTVEVLLSAAMPRLQDISLQRAGNKLKEVVEARKKAGEPLDGLPNLADTEATLAWYFSSDGYLSADGRKAERERLQASMKSQQEQLKRLEHGG
ncbi:MAG TPA: hypothetical protein VGE69_00950 [Pseudomonadales bacterium]